MTRIGSQGIQPLGTPGVPTPATRPQPGVGSPPASTGLQTRASTQAGAPRNAALPIAARTTASAGNSQGVQLTQLGAAKSRASLGIDPNRLRNTEVMAEANSLENVALLKIEILGLKEDVALARQKATKDAMARGDTAGAQQASQAFNELNRELDQAFGFLKGKEQQLVAAETAAMSGSQTTLVGTAAGKEQPSTAAEPAGVSAGSQTTLVGSATLKMEDLKPAPWYKPPLMLSPKEKIRRQYDQLKLNLTPDTLPAFTDANVTGGPKKLGSGACNTVYSVQLSKPDGSKLDGVFKPLSKEEMGEVAEATGIPHDNPQIAMRNLATVDYAKALGFDVVADTKVAVLAPSPGEDPKVGLMMERAQGKTARDTPSTTLGRSDAIREMTKLQLLDHLTGQGDRHGHNYFVDVRPDGSVKITGIDNDQCFGKNMKDPAGIRWTGTADCPFRGTDLPPVVDTDMAAAINRLAPDDLRKMLGDKLSEEEVGASIQRLDGMKKHIAALERQGRVIEPGGWGAAAQHIDFDNSYAGRAILTALAQEKNQKQEEKQW